MWDAVGITGADAEAYEALVRRGPSDAESLAAVVGLPPARATRILGRLVERGLVTRLPVTPMQFVAVPPDVAAGSLIAERESELRALEEHAERLAAEQPPEQRDKPDPASLIEIVDGALNVQNAFVRLQRSARREIRAMDTPPYLEHPVSGNTEQYRLTEQRSLIYRVVYHPSALTIPGRVDDVWRRIQSGERARVSARVPMKMVLSDDQLALLPVSRRDVADAAYLVRPSSLLDALSALFDAVWDRAVAFNRPGANDPEAAAAPVVSPELLGLLVAGATDETIARTLGWSVRTVHRHIHKMMTDVGAETRFQAGMEAVRRGWA